MPARPPRSFPIAQSGVPSTSSEALLGGANELQILHRGEVYRLTLTRSGKLILHK